jgi:hypothetical protein
MAKALEVSDQRGQPGTHQTAGGDVFGQGRLAEALAVEAPVFGARVLCHDQLRRFDVDLLDDPTPTAVALEWAATAGTTVQGVFPEMIDLLPGKRGAFVLGMTRLTTGFALVLAGRKWRRRRFDEVRRGGFGGGRGILASSGELLLQTHYGSLHLLQLNALLLQERLQLLASGTGTRCGFSHDLVLRSGGMTGEKLTP